MAALHAHEILDTPTEPVFDDLVRLAATACGAPIALLTFVDADRQWVKARVGIELSETRRADAICAEVIARPDEVMVVPDLRADERFANHALVRDGSDVRFYAGAALVTSDGHALGVLCVLDREPRALGAPQIEALRALARQAVAQLELRRGIVAAGVTTAETLASHNRALGRPSEPPPHGKRSQSGEVRRLAALGAAVVITSGLVLAQLRGNVLAEYFGDLMFIVSGSVAALACARRSRRSQSSGWRWLAVACATWAAGAVAWAWFGLTRDEYPFPSVADVGFLGYLVPALIGLWRLHDRGARPGALAWTLVDTGVVISATLFVSWATVLGPLLDARGSWTLTWAVSAAYPVVDVVVISAALALGLRRRGPDRWSFLLLAAGFTTLGVADSIYSLQVLEGSYDVGNLLDVGWIAAFTLIAVAATLPEDRSLRAGRHLDVIQEIIPFIPVVAAIVVAATRDGIGPDATPFLFWAAIATFGLATLRQVTISSEKVALARDLEARVAERTAEVDGQRLFLASVLDTLQEGVVACDASGEITLSNTAMRRLVGGDLAGRRTDPWVVVDPDHPDQGTALLGSDAAPLERALRGEVFRDVEVSLRGPARRPIVASVNGGPITDATGATIGAVIAVHDVTDRVLSQQDLERRATHDDLTGLPNRVAFKRDLTAALAANSEVSLLLLDVDNFKQINDTLGHSGGDTLLVHVAARLEACLRDGDWVARLGGDEFTVIVSGGEWAARSVARRALAAVEAPLSIDTTEVTVGASIGIAVADGCSASELLQRADLAMYDAKARGRGDLSVFSPSMQDRAVSERDIERDLRGALRDGRLHLAYQPVVDLGTGQMTGVEALLRYTDPVRGPVSPSEFIPVAERCGLILPIGEWVIASACRQLAEWQALDVRAGALSMAVNVSIRQLERPGLVEVVRAALAASGVAASRLVLEITESVLVEGSGIVERIAELHELGVRVSIDDFGTGYSSLARLRSYYADCLKIDRSFVEEIVDAASDPPILRATLAMARGLDLSVVAEGIETAAQYEYLRKLGCGEAQGFLMSRPLPGEDIPALLGVSLGPDGVGPHLEAPADGIDAVIAAAVSADVDLAGLARPLIASLQQLTGLESTYLTRIDWEALQQHVLYAYNAGSLTIPEGLVVEWSDTLCRRALEGGPQHLDDVPDVYPDSAAAAQLGITTYVTVPIETAEGQVFGTLCGISSKPMPMSDNDMAMIRLFGRLVAAKLTSASPPDPVESSASR